MPPITKARRQGTKVWTGTVRLSYVHLFEKWSMNPEQEGRYSTAILIPKTDKETKRCVDEAIEVAISEARERGKLKKTGTVKTTLHDGDEDADLEQNPEYVGHWYLTTSFFSSPSRQRPGIVDDQLNLITDPSEVYSGCYARVTMTAFAYSNSGNTGVSFGLANVQKLADGENLGGGAASPDSDFDALEDEDDGDSVL